MGAQAILQNATSRWVDATIWRMLRGSPALTVLCTLWHIRYPGVVRDVPFCAKPYGCAFDEILTDPHAVYIKLDDDIIFIKDGSFEHLVYQVSAVCGGARYT